MKWYWYMCSGALLLQGCGGDPASPPPVNPLAGIESLLDALTRQVDDLKSLVLFVLILAAVLALAFWGIGFFLGAGIGSAAKSASEKNRLPRQKEDP